MAMASLDFSEFCRTKGLTDKTADELRKCDYADTEKLRTLTTDEIRKNFKGKITKDQILLLMDVVDDLNNSYDLPREPVGRDVPTDDMTRIILVGKTGAGKSSTGNTIIGQDKFTVKLGLASAPFGARAQTARTSVDGKMLYVLDTPGLTDTKMNLTDVALRITQCMALCTPGPHHVLFVIKMGRFTIDEVQVYETLKRVFGDDLLEHMIIVFTGVSRKVRLADPLREVRENNNPEKLLQILRKVGDRFCFLDNNESGRDEIVRKLLAIFSQREPNYFEKGKMAEVNKCVDKAVDQIMKEHNIDRKQAKSQFLEEVERDLERVKKIESQIGMRKALRSALVGGAAGAATAFGLAGGVVGAAVGGAGGGVAGGVYSYATGKEPCGIL